MVTVVSLAKDTFTSLTTSVSDLGRSTALLPLSNNTRSPATFICDTLKFTAFTVDCSMHLKALIKAAASSSVVAVLTVGTGLWAAFAADELFGLLAAAVPEPADSLLFSVPF